MRLVARKVLRCLSVPIRLLLMLALIALRNAARFECGRALSNWAARAFCLASARASAFHSICGTATLPIAAPAAAPSPIVAATPLALPQPPTP